MRKRIFAVFAVFALAAFALPRPGLAQQSIIAQFKKPMPDVGSIPEADFTAATREMSERPGKDPDLEYVIRLPANWTRVENGQEDRFVLADKIMGEFAKFYSPAPAGIQEGASGDLLKMEVAPLSDRSYVLMRAGKIAYTMSAHEWFMQHLLANNYTLQGMTEHGEYAAEALYVVLAENRMSYAVRGMARINGGKLIFTEYYMPIEKWEGEKALQAQVIQSFTMKNRKVSPIEPLSAYRFLDIEEVSYPSSWTLQTSPIRSVDRMKIKLLNIRKAIESDKEVQKLDGRMDVEMISTHTSKDLDQEIERQKESLDEQGLILGKVIESPENFILNPTFDFAETTVYESSDNQAKFIGYEFWSSVVSADDYYFFITLLTPSREADYFLWAKNRQHYKLLIDSIKPTRNRINQEE